MSPRKRKVADSASANAGPSRKSTRIGLKQPSASGNESEESVTPESTDDKMSHKRASLPEVQLRPSLKSTRTERAEIVKSDATAIGVAKRRGKWPAVLLPFELRKETDAGYLDMEVLVGDDPEDIFRAEGGDPDNHEDLLIFKPGDFRGRDSDDPLLAKNRSEPDLIGHIATISHKLTNLSAHVTRAYLLLWSKGKNPRKKLNAAEVEELNRLKKILEVDVIAMHNLSIAQLHQTAKRLTKKLAQLDRIRVELRNQTVAKQKKLELSEAEVLLLNQNLSESQSDCLLAQENEKICLAEIVQLNLVISQLLESGNEDLTESERIRAELNEKFVTQQECTRQLQSKLVVAEEKLKQSDSLITSLEKEVAELKNASLLDKANLDKEKAERDRLQLDLQSAKEKLKQSDAQVASLQRKIDERSRTVATSELSREALRAQNLELMKKVNQMDQLLIESDRLNAHVVKIQSELKCAQDKITSLEDEMVRLNRCLSESQLKLKLSQEMYESSLKKIASLEAEVKELRAARLNMDEFDETQADPSLDHENFDNIASLQEPIVVQRQLNVSPTDLVESGTDYLKEAQSFVSRSMRIRNKTAQPKEQAQPETFDLQREDNTHLRGVNYATPNKKYSCSHSQCHFSTELYERLKTHRKRHQERTECPKCHKSVQKSRLSKHLKLATQKGSGPYKTHKRRWAAKRLICQFCPKRSCPKTYSSLLSLNDHQNNYHQADRQTRRVGRPRKNPQIAPPPELTSGAKRGMGRPNRMIG